MTDIPPNPKEIFLRAIEIPEPGERAAFLDKSCSGDDALRQRVEDLLRAYGQSGGPLDKLAAALAPTQLGETIREQPGTVIGPYKLMEQIGEGGFGLVFVAEQQQPIRRKVALKIIKPGMDTRDVIARFKAEQQALALMDHPNIARVFDAGTTESGRPYFVMELVRGIPITDYCDRSQLTPRERLELFIPVCNAIQHAHLKGIIHRDIKPSNVLVTLHDGRPVVKVIDFGVAKALHQSLTDRTIYTRFAQMIGTPLYMSPEQAEMSGLDIDTRTDVYSLGVLLYELLTGTTPFDKQRLARAAYDELLKIIREEEPPKPSARLSKSTASLPSIASLRKTEPTKLSKMFHGDLDWITMKALEKDRTRRYETANGFAADVQRYLSDEPVEASPPSTGYRLRKLGRRHRAALLTISAFVAVLIAGMIISTSFAIRADRAKRDAIAAQSAERTQRNAAESERNRAVEAEVTAMANAEKARTEAVRADAKADEARRSQYFAHIHLAQDKWQQGYGAAASDLLQEYVPARGQSDLRGWEWYYQERLCHQELRTFRPQKTDDDRQPRGVTSVAFSPDGKRLATADTTSTVALWDVSSGKEVGSLKGHTNIVRFVVYCLDGKQLATAADDQTIRLWDAASCKQLPPVSIFDGDPVTGVHFVRFEPRALAISADGRTLGSMDWAGNVRLWNVSDRTRIHARDDLYLLMRRTMCAAFSPDLSQVAAVAGDLSSLKIGNITRDEMAVWIPGYDRIPNFNCLGFSSDGKCLAACAGNSPIHLWDVSVRDATPRSWDGRIENGLALAFSPDGNRLAVGEAKGVISVWSVPDGKLLRNLSGHKNAVKSLAFNFDGSRLASGSDDGTAKLWDLSAGKSRPVRQWDSHLSRFDHVWVTSLEEIEMHGEIAAGQNAQVLGGIPAELQSAVLSADGGLMAAISYKYEHTNVKRSELNVFDLVTASPISIDTRKSSLGTDWRDIVVQRDGTFLIAGMKDDGCTVVLCRSSLHRDPNASPPQQSFKEYLRKPKNDVFKKICDVVLSRDGKFAAACGEDGTVTIWDVETDKPLQAIHAIKNLEEFLSHLKFSPDGSLLAGSSGGHVFVWTIRQLTNSSPFLKLATPSSSCLAFSGDNSILAAGFSAAEPGDEKAKIALWSLPTGRLLHTLPGNAGNVNDLAFSRDGKRLLSCGEDRTVKIWDTATGQELLTLRGHTDGIRSVAFSPDGYSVISASNDRTIRILDARPSTPELDAAHEGRSITEYLAVASRSKVDLAQRIERYPGVSGAVRQQMREFASSAWDAEISSRRAGATSTVPSAGFFEQETRRQDASSLNRVSWETVRRADAKPDALRRALRYAEEANLLLPGNASILNTVGVAQFRVGRYVDALATLQRSHELYSKSKSEPIATDLAFLAMTHHSLGHAAEAKEFLRQLTKLLEQPGSKDGKEAAALFREAKQHLSQ